MATQTLRGLANQGPMHWRGDRTGAEFFNDQKAHDTTLAFKAFNVAFDSLLGRDEGEISDADMTAFADFVLRILPPPNPVRALDNVLTASQAQGREIFLNRRLLADSAAHCGGCHTLQVARGQFGTLGQTTFDDEPQEFKVPQLKNMYQKVGMFGTPNTHLADILPEDASYHGDQIRGFGFLHDGSVATLFDFFRARFFELEDDQRLHLEQYMLAFDTTFAPIVGQQITLTKDNAGVVGPRIDLMIARAATRFALQDQPEARECDLIAKAVSAGQLRGYRLSVASGDFQTDRAGEAELTDGELRSLASIDGQQITYTCAPPGEGVRLGIDRDEDGILDQDEADAPTPAPTPTTTPTATETATPTPTPVPCLCDCDDDRVVAVAEVITAVNIALGDQPISACPSLDRDEDGSVAVTDLVRAVDESLNGCDGAAAHARSGK
jgi:hypothetical protein